MQRILVFGANGRVGSIVVNKLLKEDFHVIAFIYGSSSFDENEKLTVIKGDVHDKDSVEAAVAKSDIVVSTLGSWGTKTKDILTAAIENIIPAMEKNNLRRIITLTGADARAHGDRIGFVHALLHLFLRFSPAKKILQDSEKHITLLEKTQLDWTTLRSPIMNEKGKRSFRLSTERPRPWQTIHRDAVAEAVVEQIKNDFEPQKAPFLHR
jgi:putative NADH-flavin reductase